MARYALLSDIHGNADALEAVLALIRIAPVDGVMCLGDVVGYGAEPGACLDMVYESCDLVILGNHDEAALSDGAMERFNENAKRSIVYTRERLTREQASWMRSWPRRASALDLEMTHGAFGPDPWEYLCDGGAALRCFDGYEGVLGAVGHTHIPAVFTIGADGLPEGRLLPNGARISLPHDKRCIVNPGSVGQPRDRNPDAAWALLDTDELTIQVHRASYDVEAAHRKIQAAGLPGRLGERLRIGA